MMILLLIYALIIPVALGFIIGWNEDGDKVLAIIMATLWLVIVLMMLGHILYSKLEEFI